ncbi:hypothetical protein H1R20_g1309, partial [Candolleomyces eurysporus]
MLNQLAPYYNLHVQNPGERTADFSTKAKAAGDASKTRKPLASSLAFNADVKPLASSSTHNPGTNTRAIPSTAPSSTHVQFDTSGAINSAITTLGIHTQTHNTGTDAGAITSTTPSGTNIQSDSPIHIQAASPLDTNTFDTNGQPNGSLETDADTGATITLTTPSGTNVQSDKSGAINGAITTLGIHVRADIPLDTNTLDANNSEVTFFDANSQSNGSETGATNGAFTPFVSDANNIKSN